MKEALIFFEGFVFNIVFLAVMVSDSFFAALYYQTKFDENPKPKHFIFSLLATERD